MAMQGCLMRLLIAKIRDILSCKAMNMMILYSSDLAFDSMGGKRSCSISNGRIKRNDTTPLRRQHQLKIEEIPIVQKQYEHNSPETTRYKPSEAASRSPDENEQTLYDLNEIELPAYCKDHPDSKLLYVVKLNGDEILSCVYCALELTNK